MKPPAIVSSDETIEIAFHDVAADQAQRLADLMSEERERVRDWWGGGYDGPIRVEISGKNRISKALVPAWRGERGRMQIARRTVRQSNTASLHEIVHVEAPNGNRFLAEGLAVYLHTELGGVAAFPNFGDDLHEAVREFADGADLCELDAIATPRPIGEIGKSDAYLVAGSFVRFLVEAHGQEKFRRLYALTPFRPGESPEYDRTRYRSIYGIELAELARDWREAIAP